MLDNPGILFWIITVQILGKVHGMLWTNHLWLLYFATDKFDINIRPYNRFYINVSSWTWIQTFLWFSTWFWRRALEFRHFSDFRFDFVDEHLANYYRYYRRYAPKVDIRIVIAVSLTIISVIQVHLVLPHCKNYLLYDEMMSYDSNHTSVEYRLR